MRITGVEPTELFTGTAQRPLQIVGVTIAGGHGGAAASAAAVVSVRVEGATVSTPWPAEIACPEGGKERVAEVGVELAAPVTEGSSREATVIAELWEPGSGGKRVRTAGMTAAARITAAVPGWTMWMVSHFHYDPVWWNTQGQFTESRLILPDDSGNMPATRTAFELVSLHLDMARTDSDYKFVLAEIDYLKPYFDAHPQRRAELKRLISEGRVEIVGGNYNEANTNLTCAESAIRNAVYGIGFQRDVLGADPATAWMLDVFGHDPSYPSLMAAAGLGSSAWARGPFHQWGPNKTVGGNLRMQFPSEFEWLSPDGGGLLTAYLPNHYGAGWAMEQHRDLASAQLAAYEQFQLLKPVAATRNVLLPVGADHVVPPRWCTQIHRGWNARYVWPRFITAVPREFFAAVRGDARSRGIAITPQTRDMNPVYPGKDVSYIDTKQAQRAAETAVMDGERLATLAWLHGAPYPDASIDKAWRQLIYGGHHDAITGTESDQVYLDLVGGWREAYERGDCARRAAAAHLAGLADTAAPDPPGWQPATGDRAVVVFNTLAGDRGGLVTATLRCPEPGTGWLTLHDGAGAPVAALADGVLRHHDGTLAEVTLTWWAHGVPGLGYRTYWVRPGAAPAGPPGAALPGAALTGTALPGAALPGTGAAVAGGWRSVAGTAIENQALRVEADPRRGGALSRILDKRHGTELVAPGAVANELLIQDEYDYHPHWTEGPWLLTPKGPGSGSACGRAQVRAQRCPIGSRLVSSVVAGELRITSQTLLWDGADQVEFRTHVDGSIGHDRLLRVRFPLHVPGGLPLYETAAATIGRSFGPVDTDVAEHWYTLDNPAYTWFGLGATARVIVGGAAGTAAAAIGVAEVITPGESASRDGSRGVPPAAVPADGSGWPPSLGGGDGTGGAVRELIVALARQGVTATCATAGGPRYGAIDLDSNLPDVRIAVGGPEVNTFTASVLAAADPAYPAELTRRLAADGQVRLWVPAAQNRAAAFRPGADLRGVRDLPVLIVAGADLAAAVRDLAAGLDTARIEAVTPSGAGQAPAPGGPADSQAGAAPGAPVSRSSPVVQPGGPGDRHGQPGDPRGGLPAGPGAAGGAACDAPLAGWSAALLNRGTPGSVVTTNGELHIALMRSCSGWPSGVWIDEPKRTAPDGSSFSLQHWSHTFEYALVSGPGDWRDAGFTTAGQAYNHSLIACETGIHPGTLPATASLLHVESLGPGSVVLGALKPRGNPAAAGLPGRPLVRPGIDGITVRLRETCGRRTKVALRVPALPAGLVGRVTNLLEEQPGPPLETGESASLLAGLPPFGTVTLLVAPAGPPGEAGPVAAAGAARGGPHAADTGAGGPAAAGAEGPGFPAPGDGLLQAGGAPAPGTDAAGGSWAAGETEPAQPVSARYWLHGKGPAPAGNLPAAGGSWAAGETEPAQPVFTRYWLHGKGPAPAGNLPAAVHISPARTATGAGHPPGKVSLRVTVAAGSAPAAGDVALDVPAGAVADPAGPLRYRLAAGGYAAWDVAVQPPGLPGRYFLAARIGDAAGQVLEDVATIAVGEEPVPPRDTPLADLLPLLDADQRATAAELAVSLPGGDLMLAPGERGEIAVHLANHTRSQIRGEAQLISPFGSWEAMTPWTQGFSAGPGARTVVRYTVAAPGAARPGSQWWAVVKICYFGRLHYTAAVRVSIAA